MATLCNSCEQQESCKIFEIMGDSMPITHCKNYIQTRRETVRGKQTNADRIRSMTDEELAKFLVYTDWCALLCKDPLECIDGECVGFALEWLKKEVEAETCNNLKDDGVNASKWVLKTFDDGYGEYQLYVCDKCGEKVVHRTSYCPNCGARME